MVLARFGYACFSEEQTENATRTRAVRKPKAGLPWHPRSSEDRVSKRFRFRRMRMFWTAIYEWRQKRKLRELLRDPRAARGFRSPGNLRRESLLTAQRRTQHADKNGDQLQSSGDHVLIHC